MPLIKCIVYCVCVCVCLCVCVCITCLVMSGRTLCEPMDCSLAASSVHVILQEYWSGLPFTSPRHLPNPGIKPGLLHCRQILYHPSHQGVRLFTVAISREESERGLIFQTYVDTSENRKEQLSKVMQFQVGSLSLSLSQAAHSVSHGIFTFYCTYATSSSLPAS